MLVVERWGAECSVTFAKEQWYAIAVLMNIIQL